MYSQNNEEQIVLNHFKDFKGTFLDIGAYDGIDLSNTRALMEIGWKGICVEPNPKIVQKLKINCSDFSDVIIYDCALGTVDGVVSFNANDEYYSTILDSEIDRWKGAFNFEKIDVKSLTFKTLYENSPYKKFDFVSIDCEGLDYFILSQINLDEVDCSMVCVETNGKETDKYIKYINKFKGFNIISINPENLIMSR